MEISQPGVRVWCHSCAKESIGLVDQDSGEYNCDDCRGCFVEELDQDQGLDDFLEDNNSHQPSSETSDSLISSPPIAPVITRAPQTSGAPSDLLQSILNRILEPAPSLAPIIRSSSSIEDIRPIGILIRQSGLGEGGDMPLSVSGGLLGLIASLSSMRQQTLNIGTSNMFSNDHFEHILHHILMNESSHAGVPPAAEDLIEKLDRHTMHADSPDQLRGECSISQEVFEAGDVVVSLPCGHRYKEEPIVHWLKMHNTCPVCRIDIGTSPA
jgi:hypothetical protein